MRGGGKHLLPQCVSVGTLGPMVSSLTVSTPDFLALRGLAPASEEVRALRMDGENASSWSLPRRQPLPVTSLSPTYMLRGTECCKVKGRVTLRVLPGFVP